MHIYTYIYIYIYFVLPHLGWCRGAVRNSAFLVQIPSVQLPTGHLPNGKLLRTATGLPVALRRGLPV